MNLVLYLSYDGAGLPRREEVNAVEYESGPDRICICSIGCTMYFIIYIYIYIYMQFALVLVFKITILA